MRGVAPRPSRFCPELLFERPRARYVPTRPIQVRRDMTIGVATMANNGLLVFAADRMLTRGVEQTEPESAKIYHLEKGFPLTVLWAGSADVFAEVGQAYLDRAGQKPPASMQEAVRLYCGCFASYVSERAEREVLARVGLTRMDLVSSKVSDCRADRLMDLMFSYELGELEHVETIFGGHDASGPHLYRTYDAKAFCCDIEGFAAIGSGAERAVSHLGFCGQTASSEAFSATINAFFAKRRAEQASGVGRRFDMATRSGGGKPVSLTGQEPVAQAFVLAMDHAYAAFIQAEQQALALATETATTAMKAVLTMPLPLPPLNETAAPPPEASTHDEPPPPPSPG